MYRVLIIAMAFLSAGAAIAQSSASPSVVDDAPVPKPSYLPDRGVQMTLAQISAHNAQLSNADPAFIKCVRSEGPGSLVKRRVCRTNEDWNARMASAGREARDIVDSIQTRGSSYPQEPAGSLVPLGPN